MTALVGHDAEFLRTQTEDGRTRVMGFIQHAGGAA